jgi:hypothetical protein
MLSLGLASFSFNLPAQTDSPGTVSRRGLLSSFAAVAAIPALPALAVSARTGMFSPFIGEYDDANHPGCLRSVKVVGAKMNAAGIRERFPTAYIKGTDQKEGQKSCSGTPELADVWSLTGKVSESGDEIYIDFSPKGGPAGVTGKLDTFGGAEGILFPDGNKWTKVASGTPERRPKLATLNSGA